MECSSYSTCISTVSQAACSFEDLCTDVLSSIYAYHTRAPICTINARIVPGKLCSCRPCQVLIQCSWAPQWKNLQLLALKLFSSCSLSIIAGAHTLIAIHNVRNIAPKYRQVAMIRPFSNIFLNCASGPIRKQVLHSKSQPHWSRL